MINEWLIEIEYVSLCLYLCYLKIAMSSTLEIITEHLSLPFRFIISHLFGSSRDIVLRWEESDYPGEFNLRSPRSI